MIIDDKKLLNKLSRRDELADIIREKNTKIENLKNDIQDVVKGMEDEAQEFALLNKEITELLIPTINELEDYYLPESITIKDGKPNLELMDVREDAIAQAQKKREEWNQIFKESQETEE